MHLMKLWLVPVAAICLCLPAKGSTTWKPEGIQAFPRDVLTMIVSKRNLDNAKNVMSTCKAFRYAGLKRGHVKLNQNYVDERGNDKVLPLLFFLHDLEYIESLDLHSLPLYGGYSPLSNKLADIMRKNSGMRYIALHLSEGIFSSILTYLCPLHQLQSLKITALGGLPENAMEQFLGLSPELQFLRVTGSIVSLRQRHGGIILKDLSDLFIGSGQSLREIDFTGCNILLEQIISAVSGLPQLKRVVLDAHYLPNTNMYINGILRLEFVGEGAERRTVPRLISSPILGGEVPLEYGLSYDTIIKLLEQCPPLKYLALCHKEYGAEQLKTVGRLCFYLEDLKIIEGQRVSQSTPRVLAGTEEVLDHLPVLNSLLILRYPLPTYNPGQTDFDSFWGRVPHHSKILDISRGGRVSMQGARHILSADNIRMLIMASDQLESEEIKVLQKEFSHKQIVLKKSWNAMTVDEIRSELSQGP